MSFGRASRTGRPRSALARSSSKRNTRVVGRAVHNIYAVQPKTASPAEKLEVVGHREYNSDMPRPHHFGNLPLFALQDCSSGKRQFKPLDDSMSPRSPGGSRTRPYTSSGGQDRRGSHRRSERHRSRDGRARYNDDDEEEEDIIESVFATLRHKYDRVENKFKSRIESLEEQNRKLSERTSVAEGEKNRVSEALANAQAALLKLQDRKKSKEAKKATDEMNAIHRLEECELELAAVRQHKDELAQQVQAERKRFHSEMSSQRQRMQTMQLNLAATQQRLDKQSKLARKLQISLLEKKENEDEDVVRLSETIRQLRQKNVEIELEKQQLALALAKTEASMQTQTQFARQVSEENAQLKDKVDALARDLSEQEVKWQRNEANGLRWSATIVDLRRERDEMEDRMQALRSETVISDTLKTDLINSRATVDEQNDRIRELEGRMDMLEKQIIKYRTDLGTANQEKMTAQGSLRDLEMRYEADTAQLEETARDRDALHAKRKQLQAQVKQLQDTLEARDKQNTNDRLSSVLGRLFGGSQGAPTSPVASGIGAPSSAAAALFAPSPTAVSSVPATSSAKPNSWKARLARRVSPPEPASSSAPAQVPTYEHEDERPVRASSPARAALRNSQRRRSSNAPAPVRAHYDEPTSGGDDYSAAVSDYNHSDHEEVNDAYDTHDIEDEEEVDQASIVRSPSRSTARRTLQWGETLNNATDVHDADDTDGVEDHDDDEHLTSAADMDATADETSDPAGDTVDLHEPNPTRDAPIGTITAIATAAVGGDE
jgi:hypothetical protein